MPIPYHQIASNEEATPAAINQRLAELWAELNNLDDSNFQAAAVIDIDRVIDGVPASGGVINGPIRFHGPVNDVYIEDLKTKTDLLEEYSEQTETSAYELRVILAPEGTTYQVYLDNNNVGTFPYKIPAPEGYSGTFAAVHVSNGGQSLMVMPESMIIFNKNSIQPQEDGILLTPFIQNRGAMEFTAYDNDSGKPISYAGTGQVSYRFPNIPTEIMYNISVVWRRRGLKLETAE